ncbi:MAG: hypothetical protein KGJ62_15465 [Armatimonadetes bacterium]|nr:hypothetical protein [Armatimonadota bacterium]
MMRPRTFSALVRAGGPERFVREASERAARLEREHWLKTLEAEALRQCGKEAEICATYLDGLRRKLNSTRADVAPREDRRGRVQRLHALGVWGEHKAVALLKRAGFSDVCELNAQFPNHQFADILAERDGKKYLIGVKTRNKYQASGRLNPTYNIRKKEADIQALADRHEAVLAWVAISVVPEQQKFSAYFGTIDEIQSSGERFSIPMTPEHTARYDRLSCPLEETDSSIEPDWTNGGNANRPE